MPVSVCCVSVRPWVCIVWDALGGVQVLREVKSVYRTVCEGIINLADKFFEMERADATRALVSALLA